MAFRVRLHATGGIRNRTQFVWEFVNLTVPKFVLFYAPPPPWTLRANREIQKFQFKNALTVT
jgi:hypothetical protein